MKKIFFTLLAVCCCASNASGAQRMRDFSMPADESLRQAQTNQSKTIAPANPQPAAQAPARRESSFFGDDRQTVQESGHFMDAYCDPNVRIGVATQGRFASCIEENRKTACDEYAALPNDARKVLNLTIDCEQSASETASAEAEEMGITPIAQPKGCETTSDKRIDQLKKYNSDAYVTHALLFLPDMALKGGALCVTGR